MLHQFVGPQQQDAFEQAVQTQARKTLSPTAASFALRVSLERLYALIRDDALDAWAWFPLPSARASQYRVSLFSVVAYGIRQGIFPSAEDARYLVTAEEYAALEQSTA